MPAAALPDDPLSRAQWLEREQLLDRFEAAWRDGRRPDVDEFWGANSDLHILAELALTDLEYRLKEGEAVRVEHYLARYPQLAVDTHAVADLLAAEYEWRRRTEPGLALGEYEQRFPAYAAAMRTRLRRPAAAGPIIPGYEILGVLGQGGMGLVFQAEDLSLKRRVALKVMRPETGEKVGARERFLREARAAAAVRHEHVVTIHHVGETDGVPFLVMEYVPGPTLAALLEQDQRLEPRRAAELVEQVADGLAAAHAAGLVHRDVKPSNILLDPVTGRAKLTDFGLARGGAAAAGLTQEGVLAGTPAYMSPEQARGQAGLDGRTDLYSLGATLYEALTGELPFRGTPAMLLQQIVQEEPRPPRRLNDAIPRDLETVCLKAMAKEPGRRYATAAELADDLRRFLASEPVRARPAGLVERGWRWCRRNPRLAFLSAALAVVFLAGVSGIVWQWRRAEASAAQARTVAETAERNLREALDVVDRYLVRVSEHRLLNESGMQPLRRELLETASGFLRRFVASHRDNHELRGEWARCVFRLAGVTLLTEGPRPAIALYQQVLPAQQELLAEAPDDVGRRIALAMTWCNLGIACERDGQADKAEEAYGQVLRLAEGGHDEPGCQMAMARAHINRGKLLGVKRQPDRQVEEYQRAQAICARLVERGQELPDSRRGLAITYNNLGDLLGSQGRWQEAEASLNQACELWERMGQDDARDLGTRVEHGRTLMNLAVLHLRGRRWRDAEAATARALPVVTRLARENPSLLEAQIILANTHWAAGVGYHLTDQPGKALPAYQELLAAAERVTRASPREPGLPLTVVGCRLSIANLLFEMGREQEALARSGQIVQELEAQSAEVKRQPGNRFDLMMAYVNRALALGGMGRAAESAADWERALSYDVGLFTNLMKFHRAIMEDRLPGKDSAPFYRQNFAATMAEMERIDHAFFVMPSWLYPWAEMCALSSAAARADERLPEAERQQRAERYAAAGVALLRRVAASGYFRVPGRLRQVQTDRELDALRSRQDFQEFLRERESQETAPRPR
jgi:serine/threonine-protein kinase